MKKLMAIKSFVVSAALACGLAAAALAETSETDKGSVAYRGRTKMFAQWDASDNSAIGVHDDAATVWKDLVGTYDMTKNGTVTWEPCAALFGGGWYSASTIPACKMIEIVYESPNPWNSESYGLCEFVSSGIEIAPYGSFLIISQMTQKQAVKKVGQHVLTIDRTTSPWSTYYDGAFVSDCGTSEFWSKISYNAIGRTYYKVFSGRIHSVRLYSEVLTADEIAYNAAVDDIRFFKDASACFAIDEIAPQTPTGEPVCPAVTVRDPSSGEVVSSDCYDVTYANNVAEGYASLVVKGKGDYAGVNGMRLFMIGDVTYAVEQLMDAERYEIAISDAQMRGDRFVAGTTATFTASAKDGTAFERWYGDVPEDQATNAQITIFIDGDKRLIPYFKSSWKYANGQITDGYWTLSVSASGTDLTTTSLVGMTYDFAGILDLAKGVEDGYRLVAAGMNTCYNRPARLKIVELRLPESMTTIGWDSFNGCSNMRDVFIGSNVTTVDGGAFAGCGRLRGFNGTSDIILDKVTQIGRYAFAGCGSIAGKAVIGGEAPVTYINRSSKTGLFENCSSLKEVIAGNGVTTLGDSAVASCGSLTNVTLGTGYKHFESFFAYQDGKLADVNYAGTIETIGANAFLGCSALKRFNGSPDLVFDQLTTVGKGMFGNCSSLTGKAIIGGKQPTAYDAGGEKTGAFELSTIREVIVGDGVTTLGEYPFADAKQLTNVVLGAGIKSLPKLYFMNATGLKKVSFGAYPKGNSGDAFNGIGNYQMLYIVPPRDADWNGFVATNVAPWATLSDDIRAKFAIPGWRKPYGLVTNSVDNIRATEWIAYKRSGMMLLVR